MAGAMQRMVRHSLVPMAIKKVVISLADFELPAKLA